MIIEAKVTPVKMIFSKGDFRIYSCTTKNPDMQLNKYSNASIKGIMQRLDLGVEYIANLELSEVHPQYGASYECHSIYQDMPTSGEEQKSFFKYLLTEKQVDELFKVYPKEDIIQMIIDDKFNPKLVKGIGDKKYKVIRDKVLENIEHRELLSKLGRYGITYNNVMKIAEKFESVQLAIQKIEDNPYCLCELISGIGFKKADVIARKMGFAYDHPFRIQSGIKYTLENNQQEGHTYMIINKMIKTAIDNLDVSEELINEQIGNTEGIIVIDEKIALLKTYQAEKYIATRLKQFLDNPIELNFDPEEFIARMEEKYKDTLKHGLSSHQKEFFFNIKKYPASLLVGYAGTGKTQMQRLLVELLEELGMSYLLLSPTGKASKLLSSYTGRQAQTIHRAIGYGKGKEERQLVEITQDFIIVDEMSMTDIFIMQMLLSKITNPKARVLFCGDPAQLAAVMGGNILHDAIESKVIPTTMLDIVFRQSEGGILDIASRVRKKEKFIDDNFSGMKKFGDNLIIHCVDQNHMKDGYKHYYKKYLNKYDPMDIMVLTPTKKGEIGTIEVNKYIQELVNPQNGSKAEYQYGDSMTFRQDDYVMNVKNTYDIENEDGEAVTIVNGDSGVIKNIVLEGGKYVKYVEDDEGNEEEITVDPRGTVIEFDDDTVKLSLEEMNQLIHAWSITCHKSQGSSSKAVLIIADRSHKFQLSCNLIYTAITRSVDFCIILTQAETLNYAIRKVDNLRRQTFLESMLRSE